jgi:hypothetical protein
LAVRPRDSTQTTHKKSAAMQFDQQSALCVVASFCHDSAAEDQFHSKLLDERVRPLFIDRRGMPAVCAIHIDPCLVCFDRDGGDRPWRRVPCLRPMPMHDVDGGALSGSWALDLAPGDDKGLVAPSEYAVPQDAYEAFSEAAREAMRCPHFVVVWSCESARRGTLLECADPRRALIEQDANFIAVVHAACLFLLPHLAADPIAARAVADASEQIGRRFSAADERHSSAQNAAHSPDSCYICTHYCLSQRRPTERMRRENAVVLAFSRALVKWHWSEGDDAQAGDRTIAGVEPPDDGACDRGLDRDTLRCLDWATGATSPQEAIDRALSEERTRCLARVRRALCPLDQVCYVHFCGRYFIRTDDGAWMSAEYVEVPRDLDRYRSATGKIHNVDGHDTYDDARIESLLADHIARAPDGDAWATIVTLSDGHYRTLYLDASVENSALSDMVNEAVLSWSIGAGILATEMAVCAIASVLADRPHYAKCLDAAVVALDVAQRAIDALYADRVVRQSVIHRAIVQRADQTLGVALSLDTHECLMRASPPLIDGVERTDSSETATADATPTMSEVPRGRNIDCDVGVDQRDRATARKRDKLGILRRCGSTAAGLAPFCLAFIRALAPSCLLVPFIFFFLSTPKSEQRRHRGHRSPGPCAKIVG